MPATAAPPAGGTIPSIDASLTSSTVLPPELANFTPKAAGQPERRGASVKGAPPAPLSERQPSKEPAQGKGPKTVKAPNPIDRNGNVIEEELDPENPPEWIAKQTPKALPKGIDDDLQALADSPEEKKRVGRAQGKKEEPEGEVEGEEAAPPKEGDETAAAPEESPKEDQPAPALPPLETDDDIEKEINKHKLPKELRNAHKEVLKGNRELRKEVKAAKDSETALKARIEALEKGESLPETTKARLEEMTKKLEAAEEKVRVLDYTHSEEFAGKYQEPFKKALEAAYEDVSQMIVEETGKKGTTDDFNAVLQAPNSQEAGKIAKEKFGEWGAQEVMQHRRDVLKADNARRDALKNAQAESKAALERQGAAQEARKESALKSLFDSRKAAQTGKYASLLGHREGDKEGNALVDQWQSTFERAVRDETLDDASRVTTLGQMHAMASAYPRALRDMAKLTADLEAANKRLAGFERSEPRGGDRTSGAAPRAKPADALEAAMSGIEALPRVRR